MKVRMYMKSNITPSTLNQLTKIFGFKNIADTLINRLVELANKKIEDEKADREIFEKNIKNCSNAELQVYIPDVYQKDIYKIDYIKLRDNGIKLISFDIDDTINDVFLNKIESNVPGIKVRMPKSAVELFAKLKELGFIVTLLTNAGSDLAKETCEQLNADGYIARANKPEPMNFQVMQEIYGIEKSQMAHVGNDIRTDVGGGNAFGVTTCLVRRNGFSMKLVKFIGKHIGMPTKGKLIRDELLKRDLWRKHHQKEKGDQYYQLGEKPKYLK